MAKQKFRGRKRRTTEHSEPALQPQKPTPSEPSREDGNGQPLFFRPITTYVLGFGYFATAALLLILADLEVGQIGAACEDQCGGAKLLGVSLEWWGSLLMAGVLGARWLTTQTENINARYLLAASVLGHAGASIAFSASMLLGFAGYCLYCLIAAGLSVGVAISCWPLIRSAFAMPLIPAAQGLAVGLIGVVAVWPHLDGVGDEQPTVSPGELEVAQQTRPAEEQNGEGSPADGQPAQQPVDPQARQEMLREAMDAVTIGDPDAPYEFVMMTDFTCNICHEFEIRHLPALVQQGVYSGQMRVRFLFTRTSATDRARPFYELVAATSLTMAGMPVEEAIKLMRENRVVTSQNGIALAEDEELRQRALNIMHEVSDTAEWANVVEEHDRTIMRLRQQYFPGRTGTPAFVMVRGELDVDNLPAEGAGALALYGFRDAAPFLEFAGVQ